MVTVMLLLCCILVCLRSIGDSSDGLQPCADSNLLWSSIQSCRHMHQSKNNSCARLLHIWGRPFIKVCISRHLFLLQMCDCCISLLSACITGRIVSFSWWCGMHLHWVLGSLGGFQVSQQVTKLGWSSPSLHPSSIFCSGRFSPGLRKLSELFTEWELLALCTVLTMSARALSTWSWRLWYRPLARTFGRLANRCWSR